MDYDASFKIITYSAKLESLYFTDQMQVKFQIILLAITKVVTSINIFCTVFNYYQIACKVNSKCQKKIFHANGCER